MTDTTPYVVCLECGGRNLQGEQFCGNCGAYLAWEPAAAEPPDDAAARPAQPGPDTDAGEPTRDAAAPMPASPAASKAAPMPPGGGADATARTAPPSPGTPPAAPPADVPALRKPTAAAPPRPRAAVPAVPVEAPPAPGDVICPTCGAGNRPERRFCRRCAAQLTAPVAAPASAQPAAGSRPKGRSTRFPFTAVLVLAVLIGLLVVAWLNRDVVIGFITSIVGFVFSSQSP
ncbi:hypothetical protein [Microbacterium sp. BK668]|uniref:hypothetical protein n=1 Tax=Microbacterium sp. BK668 TaxID=2512118 RepID=UPI00105C77B7|nr:hypothetical protein [Microbacterium sp. BK668]TDN93061.1 hypothetical protein EV279_2604 [Microbacterium sp. BK668]